ncbi:MAG: SDR family oxidoreductase [Pseudolabrys sp.]|jgi:nucleoside-diphosphate-sugar epimerase
MRVFVTGATGYVGFAVTQELIRGGHSVLGMSRSDTGAAALKDAGADVHRALLDDIDGIKRGAEGADAVIHCAFNHDFSKFRDNCAHDARVIHALGSVFEGSDRPLIVTSGTALVLGRVSTEDDLAPSGPHVNPRTATEHALAEVAARGVRGIALRLPQVHGDNDHGFVRMVINRARERGKVAMIGDGANRWPAVHRNDLARLYRLVLENGKSPRYHGVAEEGVPFRAIAEVIGRRLKLPVVSKTLEEAAEYYGWFTHFASMDAPSSAAKTRAELDWQPAGPTLLADMDRAEYFAM